MGSARCRERLGLGLARAGSAGTRGPAEREADSAGPPSGAPDSSPSVLAPPHRARPRHARTGSEPPAATGSRPGPDGQDRPVAVRQGSPNRRSPLELGRSPAATCGRGMLCRSGVRPQTAELARVALTFAFFHWVLAILGLHRASWAGWRRRRAGSSACQFKLTYPVLGSPLQCDRSLHSHDMFGQIAASTGNNYRFRFPLRSLF